jgi:hypothetical protein
MGLPNIGPAGSYVAINLRPLLITLRERWHQISDLRNEPYRYMDQTAQSPQARCAPVPHF